MFSGHKLESLPLVELDQFGLQWHFYRKDSCWCGVGDNFVLRSMVSYFPSMCREYGSSYNWYYSTFFESLFANTVDDNPFLFFENRSNSLEIRGNVKFDPKLMG